MHRNIVIGPPGTGKTFIGLKIAQMLLHNKVFSGPVLVVSLTNHALDQFLEGIVSFHSEGIVRVGGQSRSEILAPFCMKQLREDAKERRERPGLRRAIRVLRDHMKEYENQIENIMARISVTRKGVVNVGLMKNVVSGAHMEQLMLKKNEMTIEGYKDINIMSEWLGYGKISPCHMEADADASKSGKS